MRANATYLLAPGERRFRVDYEQSDTHHYVGVDCPFCPNRTMVWLETKPYFAWQREHGLVQNYLTDLSVDEREVLVSKVCSQCTSMMEEENE